MTPIADLWAEYERCILDPAGAGYVQRAETKRAFYAAVAGTLGLVLRLTELEEEEAMGLFAAVASELDVYTVHLGATECVTTPAQHH